MRRVGLGKQSVWILNSVVPGQSISIQSCPGQKTRRFVKPRRYDDTMETMRQERGIIVDAIYSYRRCLSPVPHNAIPSQARIDPFRNVPLKTGADAIPVPSTIDVSKRLNAIASPHLEKVWGKRTVGRECTSIREV